MPKNYIYLPEKGFHLFERELSRRSGTDVDIICHPSRIGYARQQAKRRKETTRVFIVTEVPEVPSEWSGAEVVLPLSFTLQKLKFVPRTEIPDLKPYYLEIEYLHKLGFREFRLSTLWGERVFSIPKLLYDYHHLHAGRLGIVVANGPSLRQVDMSRLSNHVTFGSNRIFQGFPDWGFTFDYWGIEDRLQIEEHEAEYREELPSEMVKFYPFEYLPFMNLTNSVPVRHYFNPPEPRFSLDPNIVEHGFTVTNMLLQLAAIMGCNPIYIVGLDHNYDIGKFGQPHGSFLDAAKEADLEKAPESEFWSGGMAKSDTHFNPNYTAGDRRFVPPRPVAAEKAFEFAAEVLGNAGIKVFNASPGTKLTTFPIISMEEFEQSLDS